ncbi:unnamed protein product [Rotaria sordida]|uniref:Ubiquitin-like domain-containing protein n=1 Tax=Rotaria sordida TaxID=392033 RepID=A0A814E085_9BILA|nr:unnamed protein product [Rotaria sordida]
MFIKTEAGEQISIDIGTLNTIRDVKKKIRHKMGIPVNNQLLVANDAELEDDRTLSDCGIDNSSVVFLISMHIGLSGTNHTSKLTVKTEDGGRITLDIEPSWTIRDVKKKIQDQEGILPEQQLIVINDAEVDDHRAVSYYNIGNDSSIHLIKMGDATTIVAHPPVSMCEI